MFTLAMQAPPLISRQPGWVKAWLRNLLVFCCSVCSLGMVAAAEEIIFAVRQPKGPHWYENFGRQVTDENKQAYGALGRLCKLNLDTGALTVLLDDPAGAVRDPQVHYDGGRILFSYRRGGSHHFHLYEINADGTGLKQLTDGPFDDLEPAYLPDGGIVFCSSRCNRYVPCWYVQVAILHRCDGDGQNIRPLSSNIEQDNTPWVLPDGRILYTRWKTYGDGSLRPGSEEWMKEFADPRLQFSRHILYNLSRPEKSLQLLAPLATSAGGHGICGEIFTSTDDADYQTLLAGIQETKAHLESITRFNMADFRPEPEYIRELKRYGILPPAHNKGDPIDVYETDRRYWESLWHQPVIATNAPVPVGN